MKLLNAFAITAAFISLSTTIAPAWAGCDVDSDEELLGVIIIPPGDKEGNGEQNSNPNEPIKSGTKDGSGATSGK